MDNVIKEDFIRKGGAVASLTAKAAAVPIASAVRAPSPRPTVSITTGSANEGSAGSGAGASTGDASAGAAVALEGALKKLEIARGVSAGVIAFAVISRSCTDGFVWSAWV